MNIDKYRFKTNQKLVDFNTLEIIDEAKKKLKQERKQLAKLQDVMYAQDKYAMLMGIQGMDTCGKDSLVREMFKNVNVNGVKVHSFKSPTKLELEHDFMWRHYKVLPSRGVITVFNRTHYENVLVTRVHPQYILSERIPNIKSLSDVTDEFFHKRMTQINNFEDYLVDKGTIVLKIFLYLSKDEQKNRLLRRLDKPEKNWKFSASDLKERDSWKQYMICYEDLLQKTSTEKSPWYVVPADDKPSARYIVASITNILLEKYDFQYPTLSKEEKDKLKGYRYKIENS